MIKRTFLLAFAATPSFAEAPQVVTDIAPIHSLTAMVMQGVGTPEILLPPGASPHDFSMRPSDANMLSDADVVVWVGHGLTPWLEAPIETLAGNAATVELVELGDWPSLPLRDMSHFWKSEDGEHHDDHDDHGHDDHDHGSIDPHAWLDPMVAVAWLGQIAQVLAESDPDNAETYLQNADQAAQMLNELSAQITADLAPFTATDFVVSHDGYQYFEQRFDLHAIGAITLSDAATPGPAHLSELRDELAEHQVTCVMTDPQTNPEWAALIAEGTDAKLFEIDALSGGTQTELGPDLYPAILTQMAQQFQSCLTSNS